jgi:uncharacterized protein DUF5989
MIRKRSKILRGFIVIGSAVPSIGEFARGLWQSDGGRRWLIPLVVFLCATGLVLVLASTVEALAPFIYTVF